jgi:hypothetical protein
MAGLEALQKALECDDPDLIQGQNVLPPPLQSNEFDQVTAACAICFTTWKGDCQGSASVGEVDIRFAEICSHTGLLLREAGAVRYFLTQYDSWTREEMRGNLLAEVRLALAGRQRGSTAPERSEQHQGPVSDKPSKRMAPSQGQAAPDLKKTS